MKKLQLIFIKFIILLVIIFAIALIMCAFRLTEDDIIVVCSVTGIVVTTLIATKIIKKMKKVFYNNWFAKAFLKAAHTITITVFVLTKGDSLSQATVNHECTHVRQYLELAVASGIIIWLLMLLIDISPWWMMLAVFAFYIFYVVEYLVRFAKVHKHKAAYKNVSFEQEARLAERDDNYLENAHYFSWIKFLSKSPYY